MDYPSIRGGELPEYSKNVSWKLLNAYIYDHSQILIDECPGDGLQSISIFKYQCAKMNFSNQSIYNRTFQKVLHKGGASEINYIKTFNNDKSLEIPVENIYTKDRPRHNFLENSQKGGK